MLELVNNISWVFQENSSSLVKCYKLHLQFPNGIFKAFPETIIRTTHKESHSRTMKENPGKIEEELPKQFMLDSLKIFLKGILWVNSKSMPKKLLLDFLEDLLKQICEELVGEENKFLAKF